MSESHPTKAYRLLCILQEHAPNAGGQAACASTYWELQNSGLDERGVEEAMACLLCFGLLDDVWPWKPAANERVRQIVNQYKARTQ